MMRRETTVIQDRKQLIYRILESSLAVSTLGFILIYILVAYFNPIIASVFLLGYSLMWIFKILLNIQYTLQSYKLFKRYKEFDFDLLLKNFSDKEFVYSYLLNKKKEFAKAINWQENIDHDLKLYEKIYNSNLDNERKFLNPLNITQTAVFSVYNESSDVLIRSLECVYKSKWPLDKLFVTISQEDRLGAEFNQVLRDTFSKIDWINLTIIDELNFDIDKELTVSDTKLNLFITAHPDGMEGEIKGKASNENWGTRQTFKVLEKYLNIDFDMVLATSLDADSHLAPDFFHNLSFRYTLSENRFQSGYQPVHVYSNNFFQTGLLPRLVATQTTMYNLTNLSIPHEGFFFAIYSVPARVLIDVDFWVTDIIAEDSVLFSKCLTYYNCDFKIVPHWGVFEGDAVEANDYLQEIINQYKQLQRWSWGGVEGFPYLFKRLWLTEESKKISLINKLKWSYLKFGNHFFWVTTPFIFSIGPFVPAYFHSVMFTSTPIAQNLSIMSQYFAWISFIFVTTFAYLTIVFQAKHAKDKLQINDYSTLLIQFILAPSLFAFMAIPAIDAQLRGLLGKYMGYWVTPKK